MKTIFKLAVFVVFIGLTSCTNNEEIATTDGTIIELQGINKGDSTTDVSNGSDDPSMDED